VVTVYKIGLIIVAMATVILAAILVPTILAILVTLTLATATIIGGTIAYYRLREKRQDISMRDLDLQDKSQDILIKSTLAEAQIRQIDSGAALVSSIGNFTFDQYKRAPQLKVEDPPELAAPVNILEALNSAQRVLIVGGSNSGKTTLLKHILASRQSAHRLVIDPHGSPGKWQGCMTSGIGRNYDEIQNTLDSLLRLMDSRYEEIGRGEVAEMGHPPLSILIDEWRSITSNLNDAGSIIRTLLTESRKAAFSMFVVSHSERAKPLGIMGEADLKDGFTVVRLGFENGERVATVDGNVATLPGPFVINQVQAPQTILSLPTGNVKAPTGDELKIVELFANGSSLRAIALEVYGSTGGHQTAKIKDILARWDDVGNE